LTHSDTPNLNAGDFAGGRSDEERANVRAVVAFYETLLNEKDIETARQYVGSHYRQHSPLAADGFEGLQAFLVPMFERHPQMRCEIKRVFADGDFVILHVHARLGPEDRGAAVVDIFRLEAGKIVEHWDVLQQIPESAPNANAMI
jgi:predicted SnoaL-like aldol condensation-catalyzing enzyme